jgi:hypothetical protein
MGWAGRQRQIGGQGGDVMVEAAEPAVLVAGGSGFEGCEIAIRWHARSFAGWVEPLRRRTQARS